MRRPLLVTLSAAIAMTGAWAIAGSHVSGEHAGAITARQSQMQLYGFNIGLLGGMAKEEIPYDAEAAAAAANNLAMLASLNQSRYWPPGSDSDNVEGTRALPAIWEDGSDIGDKAAEFSAAVAAMQAAAGTDLDSLKGAIGALGGACGSCHRAYRLSQN